MTRVYLQRRPDGIMQIRRRSLWRVVAGPVPAAVLGLVLLCAISAAGLVMALLRFPFLLLLVGGLAVLALSAVRYGLREGAVAPIHPPHPPSPRDAA